MKQVKEATKLPGEIINSLSEFFDSDDTILMSFNTYLSKVEKVKGLKIRVANIKNIDGLDYTKSYKSIVGLPQGKAFVKGTLSSTFLYEVDLADNLKIEIKDGICTVVCANIKLAAVDQGNIK